MHTIFLHTALGFVFVFACLLQPRHTFAQTSDLSATCASTSVATGYAVSIVTAGVRASFTITARDAFSFARSVGGDVFVLSLRESSDRPLEPVLDNWNGALLHSDLISVFYVSLTIVLTAAFHRHPYRQCSHHSLRILQLGHSAGEPWGLVG